MYPTTKEFAAARALCDGACLVPTPAMLVALRMMPPIEGVRREPMTDTWLTDMAADQRRIDAINGDFKSHLKRAL